MPGYYAGRLEADRLRRVYEIAAPRVRQYLEAEIRCVLDRIPSHGLVLELGCGYGRVAFRLTGRRRTVVGIDTAAASLALARRLSPTADPGDHAAGARPLFVLMDAACLGFAEGCFDALICVQNGICAFGVDPVVLVREALRVTRPGGRLMFSSYSDAFWPHRLEWFRQQAAEGLVGEIDEKRCGNGIIACRDGFRAGTMRPADFRRMCGQLGVEARIEGVDGSSVFCEIRGGSRP